MKRSTLNTAIRKHGGPVTINGPFGLCDLEVTKQSLIAALEQQWPGDSRTTEVPLRLHHGHLCHESDSAAPDPLDDILGGAATALDDVLG